jgi:hypothetical protein
MVRNLNPNEKLVERHTEWPTRYHYALYIITDSLCNWASSVTHIPLTQENVVLESTTADHDNGNIPKSSMLALGQVTRHILTSENVYPEFKVYIMDIVFRTYFELRQTDKTTRYAETLMNSIRNGGHQLIDVSKEYKQTLLDAYDNFDKIPYKRQLTDELREILDSDLAK